MKKYIFLSFMILFSSLSLSQNIQNLNLTGNLSTDSNLILDDYDQADQPSFSYASIEGKKSPLVAGLLSAVIPGAGEFYTGEYWRAAIFAVLEAGLITTAIIYNNKGDDKTTEFENYADNISNSSGWSVVRYAEWMNDFKGTNIQINSNESLPPWERVNWQELNDAERSIQGFSHTLPQHGEQQYYEQIGKYFQYSSGWADYSGGENNANVSPFFKFYSGLRGDANDLYNISSKAVVGIYINHLLSTIDAVWAAVQYNSDLSVKLRIDSYQFAQDYHYIPTLHLQYQF